MILNKGSGPIDNDDASSQSDDSFCVSQAINRLERVIELVREAKNSQSGYEPAAKVSRHHQVNRCVI